MSRGVEESKAREAAYDANAQAQTLRPNAVRKQKQGAQSGNRERSVNRTSVRRDDHSPSVHFDSLVHLWAITILVGLYLFLQKA